MWGGQAGAMDHITVGDGAHVAGQSGVTEDVSAGSTMGGFPARSLKEFLKAQALLFRLGSLRRRVRVLEGLVAASKDGGVCSGKVDVPDENEDRDDP